MGFGGVPTVVSGQESPAKSMTTPAGSSAVQGRHRQNLLCIMQWGTVEFCIQTPVWGAALDLDGDGQKSDAAASVFAKANDKCFETKPSHSILLSKKLSCMLCVGSLDFTQGASLLLTLTAKWHIWDSQQDCQQKSGFHLRPLSVPHGSSGEHPL